MNFGILYFLHKFMKILYYIHTKQILHKEQTNTVYSIVLPVHRPGRQMSGGIKKDGPGGPSFAV